MTKSIKKYIILEVKIRENIDYGLTMDSLNLWKVTERACY